MDNKDIKNIWNSENEEINLNIDFSDLKSKNSIKMKRQINILIIRRAIEASLFMISAGFLINFAIQNNDLPQYLISALSLLIFTIIGIAGSMSQIVIALNLDYSEEITSFQRKLERLKLFSLQVMKLIFLSVPFYLAYVIIGFKSLFEFDIYSNSNSNWLIVNFIFSILLLPFSVWLYKKLSYKSKSKWVKSMIEDNGGKQIHSAMNFLNEIDRFSENEIIN